MTTAAIPMPFIYVGNEEDGNVFIQDMANTKVDGVWLAAEWSSKSRPTMVPPAHMLQAREDINYWHHVERDHADTTARHGAPDPGRTTKGAEPTSARR